MKIDLDRRRVILTAAGISAAVLISKFGATARADTPNWELPDPDMEQKIKVRGGQIYVRVNGGLGGRRPPAMFLHGGPGSNHSAFLPALALADERAVILYDQLDAGLSDHPNRPQNWTVERFVSEIDAIRAALDLNELHLVGHSWGTAVSMQYAARHPAGLKSLTLGGPYFSTRSWGGEHDRPAEQPAARRKERDQCARAGWND